MRFYSTKNVNKTVNLKTAVLQSLPPDNGLYMPVDIPPLPTHFVENLSQYEFHEIATEIAKVFLSEDFTNEEIGTIIEQSITFPAPVVSLNDTFHILELWHGPSLAFKDFGARFMASVMSRLVAGANKKLTILVATSGDTGGAVAAGFLGVEQIEVIILYPSGKVSPLQEAQLTTLGQNITALKVDGTFDDCQRLVKTAFLDPGVNESYFLSSANSINISRLIPQSFYYFEAFKQIMKDAREELVLCVPSGNFGNLTAGLIAKKMGLPIAHFIAATNVNDVVPKYLSTGEYEPKPSVATISNAMDVGAPSNFQRMQDLYGNIWATMKNEITGYSFTDDQTRAAIQRLSDRFGYVMDPHGAVGYLAAEAYASQHPDVKICIHETAHPAKFLPVMNPLLGDIDIPERLSILQEREKVATELKPDFDEFKDWLMSRI